MAEYTSEDIRKIAERLKSAHDRDRPAHFLIGAGCSISAGIPSAADLIKRIHKDYPAHCADLASESRNSYGSCMALLSLNERRDLIKPYLENAKINWGMIALAQLIVKNFVSRVLTANFDLVLENACGLLGLQPAVYDFGVAPANDPAMVVSPSIIHLHGQSYGLVLLNTGEETRKHREKLRPILTDSLRNAPLVVIGYSGSADGIFQTLLDEFEGRERLYWAGHNEEPEAHIRPFLKKEHFQLIGGADFDRFMIELAQSLGCWPPNLFANPLEHLIEELSPVVSYPVMDSDSAIDLLGDLRRKLELWQHELSENKDQSDALQELYMKGDFEKVVKLFSTRVDRDTMSDEDKEVAYWSFMGWGNRLYEDAEQASGGEEATSLFAKAGEQYREALSIKPDRHEALYNLGNVLVQQAKQADGQEAARLFAEAGEAYRATLEIKPDDHEALGNWGAMLSAKTELVSDEEAAQLLAEAYKKFEAALSIEPNDFESLNNWGTTLFKQAQRASDEEAVQLFAKAGEKYEAALTVRPDDRDALINWGALLSWRAQRTGGEEAVRLVAAASEKYRTALAIKPDDRAALNNWGAMLTMQADLVDSEQAKALFAEAVEKYAAALAFNPNLRDPKVLDNWGNLLLRQAKHSSGEEARHLFIEADEKLTAATKIDQKGTYNLACLAALMGNEGKCRQNLENAEKHKTLPKIEHLNSDTDLDAVRGRLWFQELLERQKR